MKFSLFDKVFAISLVLAVSGISLKALSTDSKPAMNLQDQVKKKVTKRVKNLKKVDYNQIREDLFIDRKTVYLSCCGCVKNGTPTFVLL